MDDPPQLVKPPQSAYLIDLIFLLLAPAHPALVVLALLQYAVRRSPFFARGFLGGRQVTAAWCIVFPGVGLSYRLTVLPGQNDAPAA